MMVYSPFLSPEEVQRRIDEENANIDAFCRRMFGDGEPEEPEEPIDWDYWAGKYEECGMCRNAPFIAEHCTTS